MQHCEMAFVYSPEAGTEPVRCENPAIYLLTFTNGDKEEEALVCSSCNDEWKMNAEDIVVARRPVEGLVASGG